MVYKLIKIKVKTVHMISDFFLYIIMTAPNELTEASLIRKWV
jgi:hypothetical protein